MKIKRSRQNWFVMLGVFVAVFLFAFLVQKFNANDDVDAANMAGFDAGYIMSDYQMGNYTSMNEAQIQAFLKSKNSCNDTRTYLTGNNVGHLSESTPYSWHVAGGHYVCMADESFNGESAAHIIWQAAQDYRINPQVLIVLLQKEQGLVTDTLPNSVQYRSAMGYGCPDTAACSSKYYGFRNQVRNAAALFRTVLDGGWTNYPLGNNYVRYSPNAACGGTIVNIRSRATSALYRYTPYQPNAAALSSSYGGGDGCSAYGNRNFYSYFEDWFGGITYTGEAQSIGRTVEDGTYQLISVADQGEVINVEGGVRAGMASGQTNISSRDTVSMDGQLFKIEYDSRNGYYTIKEATSGLALDVSGGSLRDSTQIILWPQHNECNQDWVIAPDNAGYYTIISRCSSKALDATVKDDLVTYSSHGGSNQKWILAKVAESKGRTLQDGTYQFMSAADFGKAMDVDGDARAGMTSGKMAIHNRNTVDMDDQLFEVKYKSNGFYSIINSATGLALDVSGASARNSASVGLWSQHNGCNQDWVIERSGNDYLIYSRCSSKALDATSKGKLIIYASHGGGNQRWTLGEVADSEKRTVEDGVYQIVSKARSAKVLDVKGGVWPGMSSGKIITYNKNDDKTDNQLFEIKYDSEDGYYKILNPTTELALDVSGANVKNSTAVVAWSQHKGCNQDWVIEPDGEGYYVIASKCSSKALDITTMNKLIIYDRHNGDNQKWELVEQ